MSKFRHCVGTGGVTGGRIRTYGTIEQPCKSSLPLVITSYLFKCALEPHAAMVSES